MFPKQFLFDYVPSTRPVSLNKYVLLQLKKNYLYTEVPVVPEREKFIFKLLVWIMFV